MGGQNQLTVRERILLHLHGRSLDPDGMDAPLHDSQIGVAQGIGVYRRHVPRTVRKMQEEGELTIYLRHVQGISRKVQCYSLTDLGDSKASELWNKIKEWVIESADEGVRLHTIANSSVEALNILYPNDGHLGDTPSTHRMVRVIRTAFEDGIITDDEDRLIRTIASELHIDSNSLQQIIERISIETNTSDPSIRLIRAAMIAAISDGVIDSSEDRLLRRMAKDSGITDEAYSSLLERIISESLSPEERAYSGALEALDWSTEIHIDIIIHLREALGIDEDQHRRLSELCRAKLN